MIVRSTYVVARYSWYHNRGCASVQREQQKQRRETKTASEGIARGGFNLMLALVVLTSPRESG